MKNLNLILAGILCIGLAFIGCQQEEFDQWSDTPANTRANEEPVITFDPDPAIANQTVTVNLEFGTCGSGQLQEEVPVGSGTWIQVVGMTAASAAVPDITYDFVPTLIGDCAYKFRAVVSGGPQCTAYTGAQPGVCLEVISPCDIQPGDYTTYSQGFYLASPVGQAFLIANWNNLGPVEIGCLAGTVTTYNTPEDIYNLDPGGGHDDVFRNQLITLILNSRINVDFDCLIVVDGPFSGMTVSDVIALANDVYGGCVVEPVGLLDLMDDINLNFHEGTVNNDVLTCCD